MRKKKYDLIFGMGMACSCSESLRRAGLQYLSFPGDWTGPVWSDDEHAFIEHDLPVRGRTFVTSPADFFAAEDFVNLHIVSNTGREVYANRRTQYLFNHDFPVGGDLAVELPKVATKYRRRMDRLDALIRQSRRVLVMRVDRPNATTPTSFDDAREVLGLLSAKYPQTRFEMLILAYEKGRAQKDVKEERPDETITRWTFDYKDPNPEALPHQIHVPMVGEFLAARLKVKDYRTREERRAHAKAKRLARYRRVGATNVFGYHLARFKAKYPSLHLPRAGWSGLVFFSVIFLWMALAGFFLSKRTQSNDENRVLATKPPLATFFMRGAAFGERFDGFFSDHFPARRKLMRVSRFLRLKGNGSVLCGPDGWLFGNMPDARSVYSHADRFTEAELDLACARIRAFARAAKEAGVQEVFFTFSNDKESLCPEFYPEGYTRVHPESRLDQVWTVLTNRVANEAKLIRFTDRLLDLKKTNELFYRPGTHLTSYASYCVYRWLASEIIAAKIPLEPVEPWHCRFGRRTEGADLDLLKLSEIPFYSDEYLMHDFAEIRDPQSCDTYFEIRPGDIQRRVSLSVNVHAPNQLKLFLLTDSFGFKWREFLAEGVLSTYTVFIGFTDPFILDARCQREVLDFQPDIVVVNFTERFLHRLLTLECPKE